MRRLFAASVFFTTTGLYLYFFYEFLSMIARGLLWSPVG